MKKFWHTTGQPNFEAGQQVDRRARRAGQQAGRRAAGLVLSGVVNQGFEELRVQGLPGDNTDKIKIKARQVAFRGEANIVRQSVRKNS